MRSREPRRIRARGFAMIALLALLALMSAYFIANALNRTDAELAMAREQHSMGALRQAKAALIAYAAATDGWQSYRGQTTNQPGGLPCPDIDNPPDGKAQGLCSGAANRVGRLPWWTIGSDDLRDASGERLWYAISSNFYKNSTLAINSDTPGRLTVTGVSPANNAVAVVIAPGQAIQDPMLPLGQIQDRSGANATRIASYLEGFTAGPSDYSFATTALPNGMLNDRLLVITQADVMDAVEPVVADRIRRTIKPYFDAYRSAWGRYPFAVPFMNPGTVTDNYKGAAGQRFGLVPLTTASGWVTWNLPQPAPTVTILGFSFPSPLAAPDCSASTPTMIRCTVSYVACLSCTMQLTATAANVGMSLVNAPTPTVDAGTATRSQSVDASGRGVVTVTVSLPFFTALGSVTVQIPAPAYDAATNPVYDANTNGSTSPAYWFVSNQWYRQTFYAVAPALAPGGSGDCASSPPCLTVNNLPAAYAPTNDKQAILIFAGRAINGAARPSANLGDYLEGENATPADNVFENRSGVPPAGGTSSINDRVVVLAP